MVESIARPLAEAPAADERALRQAERAIGETLEHHAHVQLRSRPSVGSEPWRRPRRSRTASEPGRPSSSPTWRRRPTPRGARSRRPTARCARPFQRDRDRIVHSKAFRRLKHKTQVFIAPEGDHYRTRLTHTLEACGIARTVARALGLNEDLTEAIGLGHDLGHPPFGHTGEEALDAALRERCGRASSTTSTRCGWSTCWSATARG